MKKHSTKKILGLPAPNYFGDCPKCGKNNGYLNIGREHWFICNRHRVKWYVGTDIFPGWHAENALDWRRNELVLNTYLEVDPQQKWRNQHSCATTLTAGNGARVVDLSLYRNS